MRRDRGTGLHRFLTTNAIRYGTHVLDALRTDVVHAEATAVLVVSSPSVPLEDIVLVPLREGSHGDEPLAIQPWTLARPHVPVDQVLELAAHCRAVGTDLVVSVGGGSVLDLVKAVRLVLASPEPDERSLDAFEIHAVGATQTWQRRLPLLRHVAVSTTLSGSEFTDIAGVTGADRVKRLYRADGLAPDLVYFDPTAASSTPRPLWAGTGVRAVNHAVESICSGVHNPFVSALTHDGLRTMLTRLPASTSDPHDLDAAAACQIAAWQCAFGVTSVGLGMSHGLGHQLGAAYGVPHGVTSCVLLPAALTIRLERDRGELATLREILRSTLGEGEPGELLRSFVRDLGLPTSLAELGLGRSAFEDLVARTLQERKPAAADLDAEVGHMARLLELSA